MPDANPEPRKKDNGLPLLLGAVAVMLFLALAFTYGDAAETYIYQQFGVSIPTPAPTNTPYPTVTLRCDDCADIGMEINIWTSMDATAIAGSVQSGTEARILDMQRHVDGNYYFKVRADGVTGWVKSTFVQGR